MQSFSYTYDDAGNITGVDDGVSNNDQTYTYDGLHRLVSAQGPYGSKNYGYDSIGNINFSININTPDSIIYPKTTASSVENSGTESNNVIDGDLNTRWSSQFNDNEWIYIDYGEQINFDTVVINWEASYGEQYKIEISNNGTDWATIYTETHSDGMEDKIYVGPNSARYVKMQGIQRSGVFGYSIWEMYLTKETKVTASSSENPSSGPEKAFDGDMDSRWSSQASDPQWLQIDFNHAKIFNTVKLKWETAYGKAYQIQVSDDEQNWTAIHAESNGDGGTDVINTDVQSARYIRIYGTERGTPWGYSLWEVEVFLDGDVTQETATASSSESGTLGPENAVDGNPNTRWSSNASDPQWLCVDYGQEKEFNVVKLLWHLAYASTYYIEISNNNTDWTTIYENVNGDGREDIIPVGQQNARYVRMYGTNRGTELGYSLWELRAYQEINDLKPTATASSSQAPGVKPENAVDGNLTSRWSSEFSDPQWIKLDFGKTKIFNKIKLYWEAAYGKAYSIQISDDDTNWTTIHTESNGNGNIDLISFITFQSARYVRLYGTERGTPWGYSLWEIEVYYSPELQVSGTYSSRWDFEDVSTLIMSNVMQSSGKEGQGLEFSGDGYARVSRNEVFASQDEFSIELWMNVQDENCGYVLLKEGSYGLSVIDSSLHGWLYLNNEKYEILAEDVVNTGTWQHVVMTYTSDDGSGQGKIKLYMDKELKKEEDAQGLITINENDLYLGNSLALCDNNYKGKIDELKIYGLMLTQYDINAIYDTFGQVKLTDEEIMVLTDVATIITAIKQRILDDDPLKDDNGNIILANKKWIKYDIDNRPIRVVTIDGTDVRYEYDYEDQRVIQSVIASGIEATSLYIGTVYEETYTDGATVPDESISYIYAGSQRVAQVKTPNGGSDIIRYFYPDHLGSTQILAEPDGSDVQTISYEPFGATYETTGSEDTSWKFTGQREDASSGLYYYNARYYDPALGTFIQPDTLIQSPYDPQTLNRYTYCRNNPVRYVDPSGHAFFLIPLFYAAASGALIGGAINSLAYSFQNQDHWTGGKFADSFRQGAERGAVTGAIGFGIGGIVGALGGGPVASTLLGGAGAVVTGWASSRVYGSNYEIGDLLLDFVPGAYGGYKSYKARQIEERASDSLVVQEDQFVEVGTIDTGQGLSINTKNKLSLWGWEGESNRLCVGKPIPVLKRWTKGNPDYSYVFGSGYRFEADFRLRQKYTQRGHWRIFGIRLPTIQRTWTEMTKIWQKWELWSFGGTKTSIYRTKLLKEWVEP
ncbi:MAG: discoidin domain-containing protein [Endomicrobiales bacterium]|nr:discoidin domain-containing protein [Endomicrobiales bacterium]